MVLNGDPGVTGNVTFIQYEDDGPVTVRGIISGLSKGMHGFHVHEKGDLTSGCKSTEGHFNPDKVTLRSMVLYISEQLWSVSIHLSNPLTYMFDT